MFLRRKNKVFFAKDSSRNRERFWRERSSPGLGSMRPFHKALCSLWAYGDGDTANP